MNPFLYFYNMKLFFILIFALYNSTIHILPEAYSLSELTNPWGWGHA